MVQRNQRDDARKRDVSNITAAVTAYNANNPTVPLAAETSYSGTPVITTNLGKYLDQLSNNTKTVKIVTGGGGTITDPGVDNINVTIGVKCVGNTQLAAAGSRAYAVTTRVEAGLAAGVYKYYCQDAS